MTIKLLLSTLALTALGGPALASQVMLQNGTGTFSQNGGANAPAHAIDDSFYVNNGWGILDWATGITTNQTAAWEFVQDQPQGLLQLDMHFLHGNPYHLAGRFRFSVTTDDRSTFADGASFGGDVDANWTILDPGSLTLPAGMTWTLLPDHTILIGGTVAPQGVYNFRARLPFGGVTGLRLEVFEDPSMPTDGPGFYGNGNFLLNELVVNYEPDPFIFYGCGVNPADALTVLSGLPEQGETIHFGIDNPLGTQAPGAIAIAGISAAALPGYPCGTQISTWGAAGSTAPGELLIDLGPPNFVQYLFAGPWLGAGNPLDVPVTLPVDPALVGVPVYFQGSIVDGTQANAVALTDAVTFVIQ